MNGSFRNTLFVRGCGLVCVAIALHINVVCAQSAPSSGPPTYTRDILPLLQAHCQTCHRPGQVAPMSLLTYEEVRPWAKSIRKEVPSGAMPPFHAAGPIGRFNDDLRLRVDQIEMFERWIDGGLLRGRDEDAPSPQVWVDSDWQILKPDMIVRFKKITLDESGSDQVITLYSEQVMPSDLWIQAIEYKASNRRSVHHAGVFGISEKYPVPAAGFESVDEDVTEKLLSGTHLYTWSPGREPLKYPSGQGIKIDKGSRIALQIHFAPSDAVIDEESTVAFWFVDDVVRYETSNTFILFRDIEIPPGDSNYEFRGTQTFDRDITIQSFNVHMHLRGKSNSIVLHYPDGRSETVFEIPDYNFDWQRQYYLAEPIAVPKGTVAEHIAVWDNSAGNPLNPDPTRTVRWGSNTADEMYSTIIQVCWKRAKPVLVKNGRLIRVVADAE